MIVFKGLIAHKSSYGPSDGIYIVNDKGEFGDAFARAFPSYAEVTVRWAIRDKNEWPETLDEVAAEYLSGHDLLHILYGNVGKYLWMEVKF